jgi:hypothetical protein
MSDTDFKDKFIAFVDVLGFKKLVEAAETGTGMPLSNLLEVLKEFGGPKDRKIYEQYGPKVCPNSTYIHRDLGFRITQISDCVIVSSEVSPAGVINLVGHCWGAVIQLLTKGIMCRGYITRGSVYHTDDQIMGSGYQKAYGQESQVTAFKREAKERGTPFVEIDPVVCGYVRDHGDSCVKEMFSRYVKTDGEVTALFPFQRLAHSFIIAGLGYTFDPEHEKQFNQNTRLMIQNLKERVMALVDRSNPSAVSKAEHYMAALDAQLEECARTDEMIDMLCSPLPSRRGKHSEGVGTSHALWGCQEAGGGHPRKNA